MCGINGAIILEPSSRTLSEGDIERMRDAMTHRGPDGQGLWMNTEKTVGFGHRRLAIIDLSEKAAQPMVSADGRFVLSFNGEIYNHAEIREELESQGVRAWRTDHSDSEVLLKSFERWGIDCLSRFRGMFAFAIWDARERCLWLARDRMGKKPLYYTQIGGLFLFASEIKGILEVFPGERKVSEEGLFHYLSFLTTPPPLTLFEGIYKLSAAHFLKLRVTGEMRIERYWDVWDHTKPLHLDSDQDYVELVRAEIKEAVKIRKVSDVPMGVFLSGGIDSSLNAAYFSEEESSPIQTFTVGYDQDYDSSPNEMPYARMMAEKVGARYNEVILNADDLIGFLPRLIELQDEPIADPNCLPIYFLSRLARDNGVTVCQLGEGADELFVGYPYWQILDRLQARGNHLPAFVKSAAHRVLKSFGWEDRFPLELLRRSTLEQPIFWGGAEAFGNSPKMKVLGAAIRKRFSKYSSWEVIEPHWSDFKEKAWDPSPVNWMSYLDLRFRLPELLLMRVDKMSMGVGLEARTPFLDHKLVELAMSIPAERKFKGGELKYLLKKVARGVVPDVLVDRKKQGLDVPVRQWIQGELGRRFESELDKFCDVSGLLNQTECLRYLEVGHGPFVWYILNLLMWHKHFIRQET